jgi:hypothetical protein
MDVLLLVLVVGAVTLALGVDLAAVVGWIRVVWKNRETPRRRQ